MFAAGGNELVENLMALWLIWDTLKLCPKEMAKFGLLKLQEKGKIDCF